MRPGFRREDLSSRYDVVSIHEDEWHAQSGLRTAEIIRQHLGLPPAGSNWLLNAGSGIYQVATEPWKEAALDLFPAPLRERQHAVCANIENIPFATKAFGGIVCVGEVLGYCDPATAINEFARVLVPSGILICDFASSRSFDYWFRPSYGRAADIVTGVYNGTPERTWVYDPKYIQALLRNAGFQIKTSIGTHSWSALARRLGAPLQLAIFIERSFQRLPFLTGLAYLTTIVAFRGENET